jgi:hypothetical protein
MWFVFAAFVFMSIGRKVGWGLSKAILYRVPMAPSILFAAGWGIAVGIGTSSLIGWLHPGTVLKWILGFALGAYVSIPNYGLFAESTIPDSEGIQHLMISNLPLAAYVITEFTTRSMRG